MRATVTFTELCSTGRTQNSNGGAPAHTGRAPVVRYENREGPSRVWWQAVHGATAGGEAVTAAAATPAGRDGTAGRREPAEAEGKMKNTAGLTGSLRRMPVLKTSARLIFETGVTKLRAAPTARSAAGAGRPVLPTHGEPRRAGTATIGRGSHHMPNNAAGARYRLSVV